MLNRRRPPDTHLRRGERRRRGHLRLLLQAAHRVPPAEGRVRVPGRQPRAVPDRPGEPAGRRRARAPERRRGTHEGRRAARRSRAHRPRPERAGPAVGRPTTAGRHRPITDERTGPRAVRRTDERPRHSPRRAGHGADPIRAQRSWHRRHRRHPRRAHDALLRPGRAHRRRRPQRVTGSVGRHLAARWTSGRRTGRTTASTRCVALYRPLKTERHPRWRRASSERRWVGHRTVGASAGAAGTEDLLCRRRTRSRSRRCRARANCAGDVELSLRQRLVGGCRRGGRADEAIEVAHRHRGRDHASPAAAACTASSKSTDARGRLASDVQPPHCPRR